MGKRVDGRVNLSFRYSGKVYTVTGKTKDEAYQKKAERISELKQSAECRENPSFSEYYERFIEYRRSKVKPATVVEIEIRYKAVVGLLVPGTGKKFGDLRLNDITASDVQALQAALQEQGRISSSINDIMSFVSRVLKRAVIERVISWNPCVAVENIPRTEPRMKDTKHRALTEDETKAFFDVAEGHYYENLFRLMINTGLRIGEVGALKVSDFDMKDGCIHVTRTLTKDKNNILIVGDVPKTAAGIRDVPITAATKQAFRNQLKQNEMVFGFMDIAEPVFRTEKGLLLNQSPVNEEIRRLCGIAEIEPFTSHAFRATFATRFIEQMPENYKILSEILGHSDIKMTLNLYAAHQSKPKQKEAFEHFEIAL